MHRPSLFDSQTRLSASALAIGGPDLFHHLQSDIASSTHAGEFQIIFSLFKIFLDGLAVAKA
jgi:hypothetical protein